MDSLKIRGISEKCIFETYITKNVALLQDDIGVSGVIGSAVFNITLVIGVCSILAPTVNAFFC